MEHVDEHLNVPLHEQINCTGRERKLDIRPNVVICSYIVCDAIKCDGLLLYCLHAEDKVAFAGCVQVFDVFAANSSFSRRSPDEPALHVCLAQDVPPTCAMLHEVEGGSDVKATVAFAMVSGADVSLYLFQRCSLESIF
jgi:hypothetical protein